MRFLGKAVAKILESDKGRKYFQINPEPEVIEWTEKGINRFLLWGFLVTWTMFFIVLTSVLNFNNRFILSAVVLSLYFKEKFSPLFVELLDGLKDFEIEKEPHITESNTFKIVKSIFNGDDLQDAIRKNTG